MRHRRIATNYKEWIGIFAYRYLYIKYSVDLLTQHAMLINCDFRSRHCASNQMRLRMRFRVRRGINGTLGNSWNTLNASGRELFAKRSRLGSLIKENSHYVSSSTKRKVTHFDFDRSARPHAVYRRSDRISQLIIAIITVASDSWRQTARNGVAKRTRAT